MKNILFFILLITTLNCLAQDNFKIDNNTIVWEKVFETTLTENEIFDYFESKMIFNEYKLINNQLTGIMKPFKIDFKAAGFSAMQAPFYMQVYDYAPKFSIATKQGKYRIVLTDIKLINNGSNPAFSTTDSHLDDFSLNKKGEWRKMVLKSIFAVDQTFIEIFTIKNTTTNNDW